MHGRSLAFGFAKSSSAKASTQDVVADRTLRVEVLDAEAAGGFLAEWRNLTTRCLEPNAFYEPAFALAAARAGLARRLKFLFVREGVGGALLGVCPVEVPRMPGGMALVWMHRYSTSSTPLLDRVQGARALGAILDHCRSAWPAMTGLTFPAIAVGGPIARLLAASHEVRIHETFERAVLTCRGTEQQPGHRTLKRARRRLQARGPVAFRILATPDDVAQGIEAFLALEARGWKGGHGALADDAVLTRFARDAACGLAFDGKCRIVRLDCDGVHLAIGIVPISAGRAYFWKIAYDEAFAAYSPGWLLSVELTRALTADPTIDTADSCADAGHPMIDRVWLERTTIGCAFVALRPGRAFALAVAAELFRRSARRRLKALVKRLRGARRRQAKEGNACRRIQ